MSDRTRDLQLLLDRLNHRMIVLGDRLFRRQDIEAMTHGWEIDRIWCGLGRRYRDPRILRRIDPEAAPSDEVERRPALVAAAGRR